MMPMQIRGRIYVLGDDVDTDQIIPAGHLAISLEMPEERRRYGGLALSGVPQAQAGLPKGHIPFADPATNRSAYSIIIGGKNFGCGSSREHACVALAEAGVQAVIARSYARIFYRNAIDGGYFPPLECMAELVSQMATGDEVAIDLEGGTITHLSTERTFQFEDLGAAKEILSAGGLFAYARSQGMMQREGGA